MHNFNPKSGNFPDCLVSSTPGPEKKCST